MGVHAFTWGEDYTEAFINLPWQIYPNKYHWVPPIKLSLQMELSPQNLFFRHGEAQPFVFVRDEQVIGRIVASFDNLLSQSDDEIVGHFGYFECVNDVDVAMSLLSAAEEWLKVKGVTSVHGPVNLSVFTGYRLQTVGFDTPAFMGEPRSPDYYIDLLFAAGYQEHASWYSWEFSVETTSVKLKRNKKMVQSMRDKGDQYRVQSITKEKFFEELPAIYDVGMKAFSNNYGYSDIDYEEFKQVYLPLYQLMIDGSFYKSVSPEGNVVGFVYGFPDVAPAFNEIDGDFSRMSVLDDFQPTALVYMNFGLLQEHRGCSSVYDFGIQLTGLAVQMGWYGYGALVKEGSSIYNSMGDWNRKYSVFSKSQ